MTHQNDVADTVDIELWAWSVVLQCHIISARAFNFEDSELNFWHEVTREVRGDHVLKEYRERHEEAQAG